MENYKIVATTVNSEFCGYNFIVVKKLEDVEGVVQTTIHYFNDEDNAFGKFLRTVVKESDIIRNRQNRAGYNTKNIVEIEALTDEQILNAYGTYDTVSGNIITQVLLMKNPVQKAG